MYYTKHALFRNILFYCTYGQFAVLHNIFPFLRVSFKFYYNVLRSVKSLILLSKIFKNSDGISYCLNILLSVFSLFVYFFIYCNHFSSIWCIFFKEHPNYSKTMFYILLVELLFFSATASFL